MFTVPWVPALTILAEETAEDRIIRFLKTFNSVSLSNHADWLKQLTGRGVDPTGLNAYQWQTNCATSALGFLAAACISIETATSFHPLLSTVSKIGTSISWIYKIGAATNTMRTYRSTSTLPRVCLVSYATGSHVEWILSDIDTHGVADHGGGGRPNNDITVGRGPVLSSMGRKITEYFDFLPLLEQLAPSPNYIAQEVTIFGSPDASEPDVS